MVIFLLPGVTTAPTLSQRVLDDILELVHQEQYLMSPSVVVPMGLVPTLAAAPPMIGQRLLEHELSSAVILAPLAFAHELFLSGHSRPRLAGLFET